MSEFTSDEMTAILRDHAGHDFPWLAKTRDQINEWLGRGDGVAVYRNEDLGSRDIGDRRFMSFGSDASALETDNPSQQMPDTRDSLNWRYQLEGTYRGETLAFDVVNPRDLRQTAKRSDIRDVVDMRWSAALDNYEPVPRSWAGGYAQEYSTDDVIRAIVLWDVEQLRDANRSLYLIDDGRTVRPYHVSGWSADGGNIILHPFPVNVNEDGTPRMRPDGQQVNFDTWSLGPRRAYHLKVTR